MRPACFTASAMIAGCTSGGTAISSTWIDSSAISSSYDSYTCGIPRASATCRAEFGDLPAIAVTFSPSFAYAAKWTSRIMNPVPIAPIRQSRRTGGTGM
jgi:hypothetical protein